MLKDVDTTTANIDHKTDLQLLGKFRERLVALQSAVATAGSRMALSQSLKCAAEERNHAVDFEAVS